MKGKTIFIGINTNGSDAQLIRSSHHANGDFGSIGNQYAADFFHEALFYQFRN
jgi:hypothetical protein